MSDKQTNTSPTINKMKHTDPLTNENHTWPHIRVGVGQGALICLKGAPTHSNSATTDLGGLYNISVAGPSF